MLHHEKVVEQFLRSVAGAPFSVLLLDYDGTLAPFSVDRARAVPYPGVADALQRIIDAGRTRLAIITGRDAREVPLLLDLQPRPDVWGAHGLQRLRPDGTCEMPEIPLLVSHALADARRWLEYQGLLDLAEIKPGSIAVHWRRFGDSASELRTRVLLGWFRIADRNSLKLLEFEGGVEMRMAGPHKGDAVRTVLAEVGPDVPVAYLGDDATDERAFQALERRGLTVLVRPTPRRTSAQVWMRVPDDLLEFLSLWEKAAAGTKTQSVAPCQ